MSKTDEPLEKRLEELVEQASKITPKKAREDLQRQIDEIKSALEKLSLKREEKVEPKYIYSKPKGFDKIYELIDVDTVDIEETFPDIKTKPLHMGETDQFGLQPEWSVVVYVDINRKAHINSMMPRFRQKAKEKARDKGCEMVYVDESKLILGGGLTQQPFDALKKREAYYTIAGQAEFYKRRQKCKTLIQTNH